MKTKLILFTLVAMFFSNVNMQASPVSKKVLVVYFSQGGNTQTVAGYAKELTGGDIFRIEPVNPYSGEHQSIVDRAKKEIEAGVKPAIKGKPANIASCDVILIGSPCWWNTMAPPVATFLAGYDLSGKTIVPFMTHEGSRMGSMVADIKKLCPKSTVTEGLPVRGSSVGGAKEEVKRWLQKIEIIK